MESILGDITDNIGEMFGGMADSAGRAAGAMATSAQEVIDAWDAIDKAIAASMGKSLEELQRLGEQAEETGRKVAENMEFAAEAQKRGKEEAEYEEIARKKGGREAAYERAKRGGREKEFLEEEEEFEREQERGKREGWEWKGGKYVKPLKVYAEAGWGNIADPKEFARVLDEDMQLFQYWRDGMDRLEASRTAQEALLATKPAIEGKVVRGKKRYDFKGGVEQWVNSLPPDLKPPIDWDIYYLQRGGIITKPTLAMLGEAGTEAIFPLSQPRRIFEILRTLPGMGKYRLGEQEWPMVGQYPRGQLQHITINNTFPGPYYIREEADIDKLSRELYRKQIRSQRAVGVF